jgi:hypothetical protein
VAVEHVIKPEKKIKNGDVPGKLELIEQHNPLWRDLYDELAH